MTAVKSLLAAAALVGLIGVPAPAAADPGDTAFLGSLDKIGIRYPDPAQAISGARQVCDYVAQGHTANQAARGVRNANPNLSVTQASQFVAVAQAIYCNQPPAAAQS
ncbi:DUF732 domain-containing protein [Candidatus Mycobacterium methanotrophicum]|uniref:DUF732 domain-containing protein n=1 Tax=Candidatus Mycobacterium methanotrophicum TaxID=2943498 RepID=A0ABY4QRV6_9MYCO|nr:DUF732 domain-containing protein [Candidatus Mycobacterium methanotrophicum]UQX12453.1 DUF732 domain-containing protein [Candidatus Mycobacterium methanotrophicum]